MDGADCAPAALPDWPCKAERRKALREGEAAERRPNKDEAKDFRFGVPGMEAGGVTGFSDKGFSRRNFRDLRTDRRGLSAAIGGAKLAW